MGNCLFLRAREWGIDRQVRKKLQIPGGVPGGGMVTGRIEPCITLKEKSHFSVVKLFIQTEYYKNNIPQLLLPGTCSIYR